VLSGTSRIHRPAVHHKRWRRSVDRGPDTKGTIKLAHDYTAAWDSKSPNAVASYFAADGKIIINGSEPWIGQERIAEMAEGFFAAVPDMTLAS